MHIWRPIVFGLAVLAIFLSTAFAWMATAELEKGTTAFGRIIGETKAKNIQHQFGGRVADVLVRDSEAVVAGQVLVRLDVESLTRQLVATEGQLAATQRQRDLLAEETTAYEQLYARKLTPRSRVLQLRRQTAEVEKELHRLNALIASFRDQIAQAEISAPSDGRVLRLAVFSPGEVIAPSATVLQFVPKGENLVIEARLRTADVAQVAEGMPARVWLTAFSRRDVDPLDATVLWVSPDAMSVPSGQAEYYVVRLALDDPASAPGGPDALVPGMQAEVLVVTGKKTLLDQLFEPFTRALSRATSN